MPRTTIARVDLDALRHNYTLACQRAGTARAMAVVKADGYGHGIREVARALADLAPKYAVACLEEALAIRDAGLNQPVVLLQGVHQAGDLAECQALTLEPVLHSDTQLAWLTESRHRPRFWLKVNTGMNRLGFRPGELDGVMARLADAGVLPGLLGFVTHLACADDPDSPMTARQTDTFVRATAPWPRLARSLGNSAAHFLPDQPLFDWSRPGIMLYGGSPLIGATGPALGLKPVMTLEAPLLNTRVVRAGESVGYGAGWVASQDTRMGMVAIGYGDGYPRHAGTDTPAAIGGRRIRLIGRVSMDMLAVDLTGVPEARPGDRVELWGPTVGVDEVAACAGTIAYELMTGLTARVPRQYLRRDGGVD
ncbi:alanine racemase [uncultured Marinobacter sp.]|jgi:alanine racemase|uniref:alanine racemase n=1 Tax=uncultured Marinobacter sp. TaxID=187379 RepID=UPI000C09AA53|nr:alanine racemase [Marinobacter sp.]MBI44145.1 alanine racemase [Oceanospirillales bacterium]|tara:strand:- start:3172 stop:4269 length:1098 start_codon:yes stop_codon:yes gene_type:complete